MKKINNPITASEKCQTCNPLVNGWCKEVEKGDGRMLDEKCPKVAKFVNSVMGTNLFTPASEGMMIITQNILEWLNILNSS